MYAVNSFELPGALLWLACVSVSPLPHISDTENPMYANHSWRLDVPVLTVLVLSPSESPTRSRIHDPNAVKAHKKENKVNTFMDTFTSLQSSVAPVVSVSGQICWNRLTDGLNWLARVRADAPGLLISSSLATCFGTHQAPPWLVTRLPAAGNRSCVRRSPLPLSYFRLFLFLPRSVLDGLLAGIRF